MIYLPDELLLLIARSLNAPLPTTWSETQEFRLNQKTLASLCLVSKRSCALVQPLLHKSFFKERTLTAIEPESVPEPWIFNEDISLIVPDQVEENDECPRLMDIDQGGDSKENEKDKHEDIPRLLTPLEQFVRTLVRRPDLAKKVESLKIENYVEGHDRDGRPLGFLISEISVNSMRMLPISGPGEMIEWESGLAAGRELAEVALLLILVPNLRVLDIESSFDNLGFDLFDLEPHSFVDTFPRHYSDWKTPLKSSPLFARLELLTLTSFGRRETMQIESCVSLLGLPALTFFSAYNISDDEEYRGGLLRLPNCGIKRLRFDNCPIYGPTLGNLIESCDKLRSLDVSFSYSPDPEEDRGGIDAQVECVLNSLNKHSESLEYLILSTEYGFETVESTMPIDMRRFSKLEILHIDVWILFGLDGKRTSPKHVFNSSLEVFILRDCNERFLPQIEAFLEAALHCPSLDFVGLQIDDHLSEHKVKERLSKFVIPLRKAGIRLSILIDSHNKPIRELEDIESGLDNAELR